MAEVEVEVVLVQKMFLPHHHNMDAAYSEHTLGVGKASILPQEAAVDVTSVPYEAFVVDWIALQGMTVASLMVIGGVGMNVVHSVEKLVEMHGKPGAVPC